MDTKKFQHEKLAGDGGIRVLHLHAGTWHDEISCHLTHVSLDNKPEFQALSYVWGEPDDTSPVKLDGCLFFVTKNLEAALRRLRLKGSARIIWIDQLCINQSDVVEKSQQVAMMPQIYKNCIEVFLWLGEIDPGDEKTVEDANDDRESPPTGFAAAGMNLIRQYASGKHVHELPCFEVVNETTLIIPPAYNAGLEGMALISNLPYWDRAWIVQENILPENHTVILGSCSLSWTDFTDAGASWSKHSLECCSALVDTLPLETRNVNLRFFTKLIQISKIATYRVQAGSCLIDLLNSTRSRRATDDRDKVFSLLGLVTNWMNSDPIVPDYSLTTVEVYAQVADHIIKSMGGSLFALVGNHLRRPGIPSWILDWGAEDKSLYPYEACWASLFYNYYKASLGQPASFKRHGNLGLMLDGYRVDRIVTVADQMEVHDWKSAAPILESWIELTGLATNGEKPYITGCDMNEAFWRCVIGNMVYTGLSFSIEGGSQYRKAVKEDYAAFEIWKKEIKTAAEGQWILSNETMSAQMVVPITARHRRLFFTEKGYIGMGPLTATVGDEVHVLLGCTLPFVTRRIKVPADFDIDSQFQSYSLVGECYLHGIMDGEIISSSESKKETFIFE